MLQNHIQILQLQILQLHILQLQILQLQILQLQTSPEQLLMFLMKVRTLLLLSNSTHAQ